MELTVWHIAHERDSDCYSIRSKTKKGAVAQYDAMDDKDKRSYASVVEKRVMRYSDAYELYECLQSEMGEHGLFIERREYKLANAPEPYVFSYD
tara:strand:+ start:47 stop:328 length:282 start_codon:yes stop_codon:yes gene_type:complete